MNVLDHFSRQWLAWIAAASWQLALLACLVAIVNGALRAASPRLRHGLWLLVLAKVFLPPSLATPVSVGHWAVAPLLGATGLSRMSAEIAWPSDRSAEGTAGVRDAEPARAPSIGDRVPSPPTLLMLVWAAGCLLFWGIVGWRYARLACATRSATAIDEGPLRVALEQIALDLKLRRVPELFSTTVVASPFLFGVIRPWIVLPARSLEQLSEVELRAVLTHELVHWSRHDTLIGWLQVLAQSVFWFHPFLWWANGQLRHERECACDEAVLRLGHITPLNYSESIVHVLTVARGRSLLAGSLVGVFERGTKLQNRLEDIMNYEPFKRGFGWSSRLVLAAIAILLLPMAPGVVQTGLAEAQATEAPYPQIVKTTPKQGATGVDSSLKEITVTFDRDMGQGMSWTGGPPLFPPVDDSRKAQWKGARACVLPVKLERGSYYRLGINSTSHQNFRSTEGVAAPPSVIYFVTKGATAAIESQVRIPEIAAIEPKNGATGVDPKIESLRVTFNLPMDEGMSWTGSGPNYPKSSDGKTPSWSSDGLTCTLPVALEAGHDYQLGLNSIGHINFQSKWGAPLQPVIYKFRTRDAKE